MLENLGHQVDMPTVMREKMEGAFGMDLSSVKLYENKAVGDAGAEAVTQGSKIAFAPGKLDFSSTRGQELLGHEMSHVASQARGEVHGSGLVNDSALEAKADMEGFKAARGESVASAPLSNASAVSAAGPMQAKSVKKQELIEEPRSGVGNIQLIEDTRPQRSPGGQIRDWFSTHLAHLFPQSKEMKKLHKHQDEYEKKTLLSIKDAEEDAALDNFDFSKIEESKKLIEDGDVIQ